ncbi:hypothetical protein DFH27DRAFT_532439 [Peziza echinospora]|nr:hypothetical protein DFH27DRAFT_532439 [Peziza echinospora]
MTELISTQMSRPLKPLLKVHGTASPSIGSERLAGRYMFEWANFTAEVLSITSSLNLNRSIGLSDCPLGESRDNYIVANELGLTARFVGNVAVPLNKAYDLTTDGSLKFGDVQAAPHAALLFPDLAIIHTQHRVRQVRAVGELKTFWAFPLEAYAINHPSPITRLRLEHPIGQLLSYMRVYGLKYGWLSTYKATVFARRTDLYRVELSPPILYNATGPSLRECFLALGQTLMSNFEFLEPEDFDPLRLGLDGGSQPPLRPSTYRTHTSLSTRGGIFPSPQNGRGVPLSPGNDQEPPTIDLATISCRTVFFRDPTGSTQVFTCTEALPLAGKLPGRVILEVLHKGEPCIAKYYPLQFHERFAQECTVYETLKHRLESSDEEDNNSPSFFAKPLASGEVICSSFIPLGYILLLSKVPGVPFSDELWGDPTVRQMVAQGLRRAVCILRDIGYIHADPAKRNVLVDTESGRVTLVDFEHAVGNSYGCGVDDGPEMFDIMAPPNTM